MAFDGEAISGVFTLVNENPAPTPINLDVLASNYDTCCQDDLIRVFAEPTNDEFKNDKTTVIKTFSNAVTSVIITLQEYVNGSWNDVATLTDNTYGTFYSYGFLPNTSAFTIDWNAIHNAGGLGNGVYRLEFEATYFAGTYTVYSDNYCLTTYNASSVDGTVKIEWRMNGTFADLSNDKRFVDFGTQNLYFSLRLEGIFGKPRSEKEEEFIKYQNGQEVFVRSEQTPEYDLVLKPQTPDVLRILQYYVYQQDSILITDYNRNNHYNWVQKDVKITSGFAPEWDWKSKKASVNLTLTNAYNNFKRRL